MVAVFTQIKAMMALDMAGPCTAILDTGDLPMALATIPPDMAGRCTVLVTRHKRV
jgi:hypothetical protein